MEQNIVDEKPLISVLMTCFNRVQFIKEAIESVLASTYLNFELIIVDDCSTDDTLLIAKEFALKDKRILVYLNENNIGDYPNRNKAASYARGQFLMYVDSDDTILSDAIENCTKAMMLFPEAGFGIYNKDYSNHPILMSSPVALRDHFFSAPFLLIGPGGTIIRRTFFHRIKGYPEKYGPANDMYFNLKATCFSPIVLLPFKFMNYRRHEGQEINNWENYLYNNYLYLKDALSELPFNFTKTESNWIERKNKRRFLINVCKYFFKTRSLNKLRYVLKKTGFRFNDALLAVFHK
jgi:glycosyltransferase involved in cell wall biosynthesis